MLTEIRFWDQVLTDAKRLVMCHPELESRCKSWVAARGLEGLITVRANPVVPENQIFVVDENALTAQINRTVLNSPIKLWDQ